MAAAAEPVAAQESPEQVVAALLARARRAMATYESHSQERIDEAVTALAWAIYKPENARALAELAVHDTGLGTVESKIVKNQRKTFGTLRDLSRVRSVGIIEDDPARGLVKYAKPVGVVAAVCPSTNPVATPVNKAMMALKGGNAVIIAPSPSGHATTARTVELMRAELKKCGHPIDLVQVLPAPVTKELTQALVSGADLAVVTGSQDNVRRSMQSGTVTIGVGAGNVPVIVDISADLDDAAEKIAASKIFDNATSCSSENALIVLDGVYEPMLAALERQGGHRASGEEKESILQKLWRDGKLNRRVIARDMAVLAREIGLSEEAKGARFVLVEDDRPGPDRPLSDEKLSLVLTVYRARDFAHAKALVRDILEVKGKGHSCGIHTADQAQARELAEEIDVVRVLVNQAHTFGNGGAFNNALPFTLSMGCGTWQNNVISENLNWRHFINVTHLVNTTAEDKPSEEELFGRYWGKYGR
jgi:sulfoacetaldehyde dehydrogenase